jgi:hypothetical protein
MATQREALKSYLEADGTLASFLTGGWMDGNDFEERLQQNKIPRESDGTRIKPFGVIRWRTSRPTEIVRSSERRTLEMYFYQQTGFEIIESAIKRTKAILHRKQIQSDTEGLCMYHWQQHIGEIPAEELGFVSCELVRFYTDFTRR